MLKTDTVVTISENEHKKIREQLIKSSGYNGKILSKNTNVKSTHTKQVPFECSVYHNLGYTLNTKQINKKYNKSLMSIWAIIFWTLLKPLLKLTKR